MNDENLPASRELINSILHPHVELAVDLLRMVDSQSTGDPTYRFQIAALTIFLAGVDKALNLACQLMYLADKITWTWLSGRRKLEPGVIECHRGLTAKLNKLHSLGLDLTDLQWIVDLRNVYMHSCNIYAGYRVGPDWNDRPQLILKASGPEVSSFGPPLVPFGPAEIQSYAANLTDYLGSFLDGSKWQATWSLLAQQFGQLPINPEPEYSQMVDGSAEEIARLIASLNERYIGEGLQRLREQKQKK